MQGPGPGLTALPVEVIHHIGRYLSVQDVLSCSLTCHGLRAALNDNCVWRKYLPHNISDLETQEQQVFPRFQMGESLTPLCEMRQHFTRKNHLMRNWREGNYVQYSSSSEFEYLNRGYKEVGRLRNVFFKDKYIFLYRFASFFHSDDRGIEIWDVSKVPLLYTVFKINNLIFRTCCFGVGESHLIIYECLRVCVYQINLPDKDFPFLYSFLITDNNVTFNDIVDHRSHNVRCSEWDHQFVKNYLLSNRAGSNRLHIWDIQNASKVGCFEPPLFAELIDLHSFIGNTYVFKLTERGLFSCNPYCLVTFDLDSKQFSNNTFSLDNDAFYTIILNKSHVIVMKTVHNPTGFYDVICTLYDFNTSTELRKIKIDNAFKHLNFPLFTSKSVVNGTFIIADIDQFYVINALTLEVVDTFNHHQTNIISFRSNTSFFNMYQNIIAIDMLMTSDLGSPQIKLWNVSRKETLLRDLIIEGPEDFYFDSLFTKLVTINYDRTITVVHLW